MIPENVFEGCGMLIGDAYFFSGRPVPSPLGLAYILLIESSLLPHTCYFPGYELRTYVGTFVIEKREEI